ncbi:MAG: VIT domain-containing protein [Bacteroidota bacterium]
MIPRSLLVLFFLFLLACSSTQKAQTSSTTPVSSSPIGPPPAVLVQLPGDTMSRPIELSSLSVDVQVVGTLATTTMEMTFFNPHSRVLEGQLYVPLGAGQSVSRFALEIEGQMREGVVVEKDKGRQVFEGIVRKNIDPGLLEWSKGNVFKARIFPIPAEGSKRILIAYEQELPYREEGLQYLLPLAFEDKVKQFDLRIEVVKQIQAPIPNENELNNLQFNAWRDSWLAEKHLSDYLPNQQIGLLVPHPANNQRIFVEETGPDASWFYAHIPVETIEREKVKPQRILLLWDMSNSSQRRDFSKEQDILSAYLQWIGQGEVQLVGFHVDTQDLGRFPVVGGKAEALMQEIQSLQYDGGTQLGQLDMRNYTCDEVLLLSDGLSTVGKSEISIGTRPIYVLNSSPEADISYLQYVAEVSGGQFIQLRDLTRDEALQRLRTQAFQFLSAEVVTGTISEMFPSLPQQLDQSFAIAGKMDSDEAVIQLNFGIGSAVLYREQVSIRKQEHLGGGGKVPRIWAQKKLAELDRRFEQNEAEITRIGKEFSIVTRNTSLIVLDRIEDYVENNIIPPPELRAEYDVLVRQRDDKQRFELMSQLDLVAEAFAQRKAWWEREFEIPEGTFKPDPLKKEALEERMEAAPGDSDIDGFADDELGSSFSSFSMDALSLEEEEDKPVKPSPTGSTGAISLKAWNPQTPYLKTISAVPAAVHSSTYFTLKAKHGDSPSFYLDMADFFRQKEDSLEALRILSNIAELELDNHELFRILGHRLLQLGQTEMAIDIFLKVVELREEEPQSYRDLGHAYARNADYQEAIEYLNVVVERKWDDRFKDVGVIAAHEINAILGQCECRAELDLGFMDDRLFADMPTDLRVVLNWDSDGVDMDLWVTDPRGEKCYFQHKRTAIGGYISDDLTGGYGPEEFWIRNAMPGTYKIEVNYYGSNRLRLSGPTTIQTELILNYGQAKQTRKEITVRLGSESEVIEVGEFVFE